MPNQRIRKKYQKLVNQLLENPLDQPITNQQCRSVINTYSKHALNKARFILHSNDLNNEFIEHQPGHQYHNEDCNYNNPNNPSSWRYKKR